MLAVNWKIASVLFHLLTETVQTALQKQYQGRPKYYFVMPVKNWKTYQHDVSFACLNSSDYV